MRAPTYLNFSLEEYRERLDGLRRRMAVHRLDALLIHTPENGEGSETLTDGVEPRLYTT